MGGGFLQMHDCIIVGGGIAGLQAAIQLGRMLHDVLVIDSGSGRSVLCQSYHNVLGYPDGISGQELRRLGKLQAETYNVTFVEDTVVEVRHDNDALAVKTSSNPNEEYKARTLLLATGVSDRYPRIPGMEACFGLTIYVCPDCDGYETRNRRTIVIGSGDVGGGMALVLTRWTNEIIYINHEQADIRVDLAAQLRGKQINVVNERIESVKSEKGCLQGVRLLDGSYLEGERGFIAFGGNEVKSGLAIGLGMERMENKHIITDPRTKKTNVPHVWAAGDVTVHAEQVTVAMAEGSLAAISIHKELLAVPSS
jgi:thioredoxin reductase (NADPH)